MDDKERQEWSQHYDNIRWKVIPIFTAGVGALVVYSETLDSSSPWPEICGLVLTFVGVLYVASFRSFRNHLHSKIENQDLKNLLRGHGHSSLPPQWNVFVLSFFAASCLFCYRLAAKIVCFESTFMSFVLISALFLYLVWKAGRT